MELLFATHNKHKLEEVRCILHAYGITQVQVTSLAQYHDDTEIPEDGTTLEQNALQKTNEVLRRHGVDCFSDDTGLEVEALNGAPGVYSARYAGEHCSPHDNVQKLLHALQGTTNRRARFRTVIALSLHGEQHLFEGEVEGEILTEPKGGDGFGYDPIFRPLSDTRSFAQMSATEKNLISHRYRAVEQMARFLKEKLTNERSL